jgi:hypothetical protein
MNVDMTKALTLEEVTKAINSLPKGKAPKQDGIPTKFFQEYVKEVAPTLFLAFTTMLARGLTSDYINKGTITFQNQEIILNSRTGAQSTSLATYIKF